MADDYLPHFLEDIGVQGVEDRGDEIYGLCPGHLENLGKEDTNASWSMNRTTGAHYCFACGFKGNLSMLHRYLTGKPLPDDIEDEMRRAALLSMTVTTVERGKFVKKTASGDDIDIDDPSTFYWGNLVELPDRILRRKYLDREAVDLFRVQYDTYRGGIFMPIFDHKGERVGGQWRTIDGPLTLPTGIDKSEYLFGMDVMKGYGDVALVESPLDSVRLWSVGIPSVATFGAEVSDAQIRLLGRNWRLVVLAQDNDAAGHRSAEQVRYYLKRRYRCPSVRLRYRGLVDRHGDPAKDPGDVKSDRSLIRAYERTLWLQ